MLALQGLNSVGLTIVRTMLEFNEPFNVAQVAVRRRAAGALACNKTIQEVCFWLVERGFLAEEVVDETSTFAFTPEGSAACSQEFDVR